MKKPLVSVIMNCYNSSTYLKEAIDSVFSQTYTNWEIIFWDNQSTDESAEIFKSYKDERCSYFYAPEHTTLGEARNLAVDKATGEWIGFLDCDDIWLPEKLEKQVGIVEEEDCKSVVYGKMQLISESITKNIIRINKKYKRQILPSGQVFSDLLKENFIPLSAGLIYKETFNKVGGISNKYKQAEDYEIYLKIAHKFPIYAIQDTLILYRIHDNNISIQQAELNYLESIDIIDSMNLEDFYPKPALRWYSKYIFFLFLKRKYYKSLKMFYVYGNFGDLISMIKFKIIGKL